MTVERISNPRMTREDVLRHTPPTAREVCLLLLDHGINPGDVPADRGDTFTEAGYLAVVGIDRPAGRFVTERRPWPAGLTVDAVTAAYEGRG